MSITIFEAYQTDEMKLVLNHDDLTHILKSNNRPISVSLPGAAISSVRSFKDVFEDLGIDGRVCVAHKATESLSLIQSVKEYASIDIASEQELDNALRAGYDGSKIVATGPKSNDFLTKLVEVADITIIIDSLTELERLQQILGTDRSVNVLIRVSRTSLNVPSIFKRSRFGLDKQNLLSALELISVSEQISLKGLAFHLDSESIHERQYAVRQAITLLLSLHADFPDAYVLDIGGGYGTDYGVSQSDMMEYEFQIKKSLNNERDSFMWQNRTFGYTNDGHKIRGELTGVDKSHKEVASERLRTILEHKEEDGSSLAKLIEESLIELWIEPGSSVFSAAGIVASEVIDVHIRDGENFVVIDAHRNQICFEGNEHIADPVHISGNNEVAVDNHHEAYIVGHLCMESDFMMYRKVSFINTPKVGDCLVWLHTGAYRSYFSASNSIGQPSATKYVLRNNSLVKDTI